MTKVYGMSDDNIVVDGEVQGEVCKLGTDENQGVLLFFSDATVLEAKYWKEDNAVWGIKLHRKGWLFDKIDLCVDENEKLYSDIAYFKSGIKWVYAAKGNWEAVQ